MLPSLRVFVIAFVTLATISHSRARAEDAFGDQTCPNVTPAGRHLNALVDASTILSDDLVSAAQAMVDGYRACKHGYDDNAYHNHEGETGTSVTDALPIGRLYARLALARSLQRVGVYAVDGKKYADARIAFADAIKNIDEMATIDVGSLAFGDTSEHRMLGEGQDLKKQVESSVVNLPAP